MWVNTFTTNLQMDLLLLDTPTEVSVNSGSSQGRFANVFSSLWQILCYFQQTHHLFGLHSQDWFLPLSGDK